MFTRCFVVISFFAAVNAVASDAKAASPRLSEVSMHVRPAVLVSRDVGDVIVFTDVSAAHLKNNWFINVNLKPLDFFLLNEEFRVAFGVGLEAGYNNEWFALGAGLGVDETVSYWGALSPGLLVSVPLRIGRIDGIHLCTTSGFVWHPRETFRWEDTDFRFGVPLKQCLVLFFEGAVGREMVWGDDTGQFFSAVGLGVWLNRNGGEKTMRLDAAIGGAGAWWETTTESFEVEQTDSGEIIASPGEVTTERHLSAGPMVSLGVAWRF